MGNGEVGELTRHLPHPVWVKITLQTFFFFCIMYFLWAGYLETQKAKGVVIIVSSHNCSLAYNITMPPVPLALQTVVVASLVGNGGRDLWL